jgi:hypothetical protein
MVVVQAREFQELAKTEALNAVRTMIEAKRWQLSSSNTTLLSKFPFLGCLRQTNPQSTCMAPQ